MTPLPRWLEPHYDHLDDIAETITLLVLSVISLAIVGFVS